MSALPGLLRRALGRERRRLARRGGAPLPWTVPWASPGGKASLVHPSQKAILEASWQTRRVHFLRDLRDCSCEARGNDAAGFVARVRTAGVKPGVGAAAVGRRPRKAATR